MLVTLVVPFYLLVPSLTSLLVRSLLLLPSSPSPPPPLLLIRSKRWWTCWGLIGPDCASFLRGLWSWSCLLVLLCGNCLSSSSSYFVPQQRCCFCVLVLLVHTLEEISPVDFGWFDVDVLLKVLQPVLENGVVVAASARARQHGYQRHGPHTRSIRTPLQLLLLLQRHTGLGEAAAQDNR